MRKRKLLYIISICFLIFIIVAVSFYFTKQKNTEFVIEDDEVPQGTISGEEIMKFNTYHYNIQDDNLDVLDSLRGEISHTAIAKQIYTVETVNDMLNLPLKKGDIIKTKGYYEGNDEGNGTYIIMPQTYQFELTGTSVSLSNGLKAVLIYSKNKINLHHFGIYGDGLHDDSLSLKNYFNACRQLKISAKLQPETYLINSTLNIPSINLDGQGAIIRTSSDGKWLSGLDSLINVIGTANEYISTNISNITFDLLNSESYDLLCIRYAKNCTFTNCILLSNIASQNHNPIALDNNYDNIYFNNCSVEVRNSDASCVMIRNSNTNFPCSNVTFSNCSFTKCNGDEILAIWGWLGSVSNITIDSCTFNLEYSNDSSPSHIISLGICGVTKNINFTNNVVNTDIVIDSVVKIEQSNTDTVTTNSTLNLTENINVQSNVINVRNNQAKNNVFIIKGVNSLEDTPFNSIIISKNTINILDDTFSNCTLFYNIPNVINNYIDDYYSSGVIFYKCQNVQSNKINIYDKSSLRLCLNCNNISNNDVNYHVNNIRDNIFIQYLDDKEQEGSAYQIEHNTITYKGNSVNPIIFANYYNNKHIYEFDIYKNEFRNINLYVKGAKEITYNENSCSDNCSISLEAKQKTINK